MIGWRLMKKKRTKVLLPWVRHGRPFEGYRGASIIRNNSSSGSYSRKMPKAPWRRGLRGGGCFL